MKNYYDNNGNSDEDVYNFVDFMKKSINASLEAFFEIQDLSEIVLLDLSKKSMKIQEDAQEVITNFFSTTKKSREELKSIMEAGFDNLEKHLKD